VLLALNIAIGIQQLKSTELRHQIHHASIHDRQPSLNIFLKYPLPFYKGHLHPHASVSMGVRD
jgi:hypothetical protein